VAVKCALTDRWSLVMALLRSITQMHTIYDNATVTVLGHYYRIL